MSAPDQPKDDNQHAYTHNETEIAVFYNASECGSVYVLYGVLKAVLDPIQKPCVPSFLFYGLTRVTFQGPGKVCRKDDKGLPKGNREDSNHGYWKNSHEFPHNTTDIEQRHECNNGRTNRHEHRHPHFPHTLDDGPDGGFASLIMGVNVFPNNDGIIHKDTESHDKRKEGHHVDAFTHPVEHVKSGHKRNRDAECHPEGQANA